MKVASYHIPALLQETIDGLQLKPGGVYADVTFGGGGHSREILRRLGENGKLYSFDQDIEAYHNIANIPAEDETTDLISGKRWQFVHGNFRYISNYLRFYGEEHIDGILADLGVSFHHFDTAQRGFSFRFAGPLDMRMNQTAKLTAEDIVNHYTEENLAHVLYIYGEMNNSRQIAKRICRSRETRRIQTTEELVGCVTGRQEVVVNGEIQVDSRDKKDLARLFQALRIEVNDEMGALRELLTASTDLLKKGGRIAILTYHSLEDRMVKNFLRSGNIEGVIEKDFYGNVISPFRLINNKVITASAEEVERNPRARSAKLRVAERCFNV